MPQRIISPSTIPPRFAEIGPTLKSLVDQTGHIDEIRLYIPRIYRRFPDYDGFVPELPGGISLHRPDDDLGPASKVLFAASSLRGSDAQILFCDDDRHYPKDWADALFSEQAARPKECVALVGKDLPIPFTRPAMPRARRAARGLDYRLRRLHQRIRTLIAKRSIVRPEPVIIGEPGYVDVLQGFAGAVIRPDFFDEEARVIPDVLWAVDDYWLSGLLAAKDIGIWLPAGLERPAPTRANDLDALYDATIDGADRTEANRKCVEYLQGRFGIWGANG